MYRSKLGVDIETFSSVNLSRSGVYKYAESDDFEIILFGYKLDDGEIEVIDLTKQELDKKLIDLLLDPDVLKTAYNANFEYVCLNKYLNSLGYPEMPLESWSDTMLLSSYAGLGGSLDKTAESLGLSERKDVSGTRLIKKFSEPRKPSKKNPNTRFYPEDDVDAWNEFTEYNRQDVAVECAIRERLKDITVPDSEIRGWRLDQRINAGGIGIDMELVENAIRLDDSEKKRLTESIKILTGLENPNSNPQILGWLTKRLGHEVKSVSKGSVPALIEEAKELGLDDVVEVLNLRKELAKTSLAKYYAIRERVCRDERIRGVIQFYGSRTGRWAGRGVQVQNLPRNHLPAIETARGLLKDYDIEGLKLIYGNDLSDTASQLIRSSFIAGNGKTFAVADYSAIEARVISWLSGEEWRLDVFKNKGGKIYEASASQMFGVEFEKICDKNAPEHALRAQGKVAELALGYQGAVGAIARMDFNNAIPKSKRREIVDSWRNANSNIVKLWHETEKNFRSAVLDPPGAPGHTLNGRILFEKSDTELNAVTIRLPSGRKLYYPYPQRNRSDYEREKLSFLGLNQITRKIERIDTYGGKLVENIVQAVARDCLAESLLKLDEAGYKIRFHVHDEIIVEVDEEDAEEELKRIIEIMCTPPLWAKDLPLNAAGFISPFYMKD